MSKVVKRFKTPKENKSIIFGLELWKDWLKYKKLFRHYLEYANSCVEFGKCDMRWAFEKWRRADDLMAGALFKKTYDELTDVNLK